MPAPFGDYHLVSYTVLGEREEIRMQARRVFPSEPPVTEIIFSGVVAYQFRHDNFGTILGHIIEEPLHTFLEQHAAEFSEGFQESGWVPFWTGSVSAAHAYLEVAAIHAYELTSAFGMSGWVLARDFQTRADSALP